MKPHLSYSVENKLSEDPQAGQLKVDLNFKSLDDFEPEQVARQVKPLRELLELRTKLADLRGSLQGNEKLDDVLLDAVSNTEKMAKLRARAGPGEGRAQMSDAKKAAASAAPAEQKVELNLLDQIVEEGRFGRESGGGRARQGPGKGIRGPGAAGRDGRLPRRRGDDQRPDRADRPPALDPAQRSPAPPAVPEAGELPGAD